MSTLDGAPDVGTVACGVFKRLQIVVKPQGGTLVTWGLENGFTAAGPFDFYLDEAENGSDAWTNVLGPVVDGCEAHDERQRDWAVLSSFSYRVRLNLPNEPGSPTYVSAEQQANGLWSRKDWLLARDIARKEYLQQDKLTNITSKGWLLRRYHWGPECPACLDWDTQETARGNCPTCFGTGIQYGYALGVTFRITLDADWSHRKERQDGRSLIDPLVRKGRCVAYPTPDTGDIFVREDSGERYVVQRVTVVAELGGIPLTVEPELRLAPLTDPIYRVPVLQRGSSSGPGVSESSSCGIIVDPEKNAPAGTPSCDAFTRLKIITNPLGGTEISWIMQPGFQPKEPHEFYVEEAEGGSDEWKRLNEIPIDNCSWIDERQRDWSLTSNTYYRVRLVLPNEGGKEYLSQPTQANGMWSRKDWLLARDIVRKEYLLRNKLTNITARGLLLKRRHWGRPCPNCLDWDTREPSQGKCPVCYATGLAGGYFPGVAYPLTMEANWNHRKERNETTGVNDNVIKFGRGVSYPQPDTGDIYARLDTGERFIVQRVSFLAEIGGIPLIVGAEVRLAPVTDIVYDVPLTGGRSSSSLSAGPAAPSPEVPADVMDWRVGVKGNDEW